MLDILGLRSLLRKNHLMCGDRELEQLLKYSELLAGWNSKINLISRRDEHTIVERHIILSLALLFKYSFAEGASLLDIGTGGGLPGIPLAILCPRNNFTLLDSIQKKMHAVEDIAGAMELKNVTLITDRAEHLAKEPEHLHKFDYIVSRAVSTVTDLIRWGKPLCRSEGDRAGETERTTGPGQLLRKGSIILYKGGDLTGEFREARLKMKPALLTEEAVVVEGIDPEYIHEKKFVIIRP